MMQWNQPNGYSVDTPPRYYDHFLLVRILSFKEPL